MNDILKERVTEGLRKVAVDVAVRRRLEQMLAVSSCAFFSFVFLSFFSFLFRIFLSHCVSIKISFSSKKSQWRRRALQLFVAQATTTLFFFLVSLGWFSDFCLSLLLTTGANRDWHQTTARQADRTQQQQQQQKTRETKRNRKSQ